MIALETDELDFAVLATNAIDRIEDDGQFDVTSKTTVNYNWIGINVLHENLKDKNVRLAIRYGVDVPSSSRRRSTAAGSRRRRSCRRGCRSVIGRTRRSTNATSRRRSSTCRRGRRRPGAGDERRSDEPGSETVAEIVQANLTEVGFKIEAGGAGGRRSARRRRRRRKRQLFYTGFTSNPDPSWSTVWFTCDQVNVWNWMSWCNKEYSRLDKEAARTLDDSKRHEMYLQMQQLMDEDVVRVWVAWPTDFFATKKGIKPSLAPDGDLRRLGR